MRPLDTSPEADAVQRGIHERMGPAGRLQLMADLSEDLRQLALARIRREHPTYSERQVVAELIWRWHGVRVGPR